MCARYILRRVQIIYYEKTFLIHNFLRSLSVGYVHAAYFAKSEVKEQLRPHKMLTYAAI